MLFWRRVAIYAVSIVVVSLPTYGYSGYPISVIGSAGRKRCYGILQAHPNQQNNGRPSEQSEATFYNSDGGSKQIVSRLTDLVNMFGTKLVETPIIGELPPPVSSTELLERIREDYLTRNYLWTGNLDLGCFELDCQFTDPTLSFTGRNTFVRNVQNLRPIVDRLITQSDLCKSNLFEIQNYSDDGYLESHWNMVGYLDVLPWKPKIDVIGRTKFWYRNQLDGINPDGVRIYKYDERWEIPTWMALLQLITSSGTMPNTLKQQEM